MTLEAVHKKLLGYSKGALIKVILEVNFSRLGYILNRLKEIEFDETFEMRSKVLDSLIAKRSALLKCECGSKDFISSLQEIEKLQRKYENLKKKIDRNLHIRDEQIIYIEEETDYDETYY